MVTKINLDSHFILFLSLYIYREKASDGTIQEEEVKIIKT